MSNLSPASILYDATGVEKGTGANPVRTDPTGTTTQPVSGPLTDTQLRASAVPVSAASLPLPTGAATEATALTLLTQADFVTRTGEVQATPTANTILARLKDIFDGIVARLGTLGQKAMAASTPVVIASDQSAVNAQLTDDSGVKLGVDNGFAIPAGTDGILAMATDYDGIARRLRTTTDGRLITNSAVSSPPGNTAVTQVHVGNVSSVTDNFYVIPNGAQLKIQRFAGGGEGAIGGSKVEIYWAPNGDTTGIEVIRVGYVSGNNFEFSLDWDAPAVGDGTRAIMIRRERFSGGGVELAGFWDGYY